CDVRCRLIGRDPDYMCMGIPVLPVSPGCNQLKNGVSTAAAISRSPTAFDTRTRGTKCRSTKIATVRTAIATTFIKPTAIKTAMNAQQQPMQNRACWADSQATLNLDGRPGALAIAHRGDLQRSRHARFAGVNW